MWSSLYEGIKLCENPDSCVIFSRKSIDLLFSLRQNEAKRPEGGGLLLGYIRGNHFEIRNITTPQPKDVQKPYFFERKDPAHLEIAKRLAQSSGNKIGYIGEWHSHPEDDPHPSNGIDIPEWDRIYKKLKYPLVFMIIGRKGFYLKRLG